MCTAACNPANRDKCRQGRECFLRLHRITQAEADSALERPMFRINTERPSWFRALLRKLWG